MPWKDFFRVDFRLLPIKAHYFAMYASMAAVLPFLPIMANDLGMNATAVGFTYTFLPFTTFVLKPVFGYLADYFQNIKVIVLTLLITVSLALFGVSFIPPIRLGDEIIATAKIACSGVSDIQTHFSFQYNKTCLATVENITCTTGINRCTILNHDINFTYEDTEIKFIVREIQLLPSVLNNTHVEPYLRLSINAGNDQWLIFKPVDEKDSKCICNDNANETISLTCEPSGHQCLLTNSDFTSVYDTYQFWLFTCLAVIAGAGYQSIMSLSDVACYELLGNRKELYGRQRLWGTVSNGIVTFLTGYLNDFSSGTANKNDYSPGFYIMLGFVVIDVIIIANISFTKAGQSQNMCKDICKLFHSLNIITFGVAVFIIGALTAVIANYLLWYLREMGANQVLLGLTIGMQCIIAEVPFFFFSGYFIKKLGYFPCLVVVFAAFALRLGLYSALRNPWMTLPVETLHGITYAVFHASMTAYVSTNALPGTEGTMIGLLCGLSDGLGLAAGSLVSGVCFDSVGGRSTFLAAAIIALICVPLFTVAHITFKKRSKRKRITQNL